MNSIFENLGLESNESFEDRLGKFRCFECGWVGGVHDTYICTIGR